MSCLVVIFLKTSFNISGQKDAATSQWSHTKTLEANPTSKDELFQFFEDQHTEKSFLVTITLSSKKQAFRKNTTNNALNARR